MKSITPILALLIFVFNSCLVADHPFPAIAPGIWRAVLKLDPEFITPNPRGEPLPEKLNMKFEEVTQGELPFTFEVKYNPDQTFYLEIINGDERIKVDDISMGREKRSARDTILIRFPEYDSYIRVYSEGNVMQGEWVVASKKDYRIPFLAKHGQGHRFTTLQKPPAADLSGKWEVTMETETDHPFKAIGEFVQQGNYLKGTFLTETGDHRFLEGTVQANKAYLSCFDGSHAFLYEAKILEDGTLIGSFRSGTHYKTLWEAKRNPDFQLANPDQLTFLKPGYEKFSFAFKNSEGKIISLDDPAYRNKVKIIQLMGTWCPNCMDETHFLLNYLKENPNPDLVVIGLAFERYDDPAKAMNAIRTYKKRLSIPYDVLHAGSSNKEKAALALPMLNQVLSYPTTIYIDRNDQVRRIHTGFSGPATSQYEAFKTDFQSFVSNLLAEAHSNKQ